MSSAAPTTHVATDVSAFPAEVIDVKTSVEEPPVAVQATAPLLPAAEKEIVRDVTEKRFLHRSLSRHLVQIVCGHGPTSSQTKTPSTVGAKSLHAELAAEEEIVRDVTEKRFATIDLSRNRGFGRHESRRCLPLAKTARWSYELPDRTSSNASVAQKYCSIQPQRSWHDLGGMPAEIPLLDKVCLRMAREQRMCYGLHYTSCRSCQRRCTMSTSGQDELCVRWKTRDTLTSRSTWPAQKAWTAVDTPSLKWIPQLIKCSSSQIFIGREPRVFLGTSFQRCPQGTLRVVRCYNHPTSFVAGITAQVSPPRWATPSESTLLISSQFMFLQQDCDANVIKFVATEVVGKLPCCLAGSQHS